MNLHEIDFLSKLSLLLKEAFLFKKYKAMSPVAAVFVGLLMLPFVIASFAVAAALASISFMYSILSAPAKYLHDILVYFNKNPIFGRYSGSVPVALCYD